MKSCSANNCPAHTRRVSLAETARKVAFTSWRGALVRRRLSRFALILCASLCFVVASRGSSVPTPSAHAETRTALSSPQQGGSSQSSFPGPKTPEQTRTEQYTLSQERLAKAVPYSRAGYTPYFL